MQQTPNYFTDSQKSDEGKEMSTSSGGHNSAKEITILTVGLIVLVIGIGGALMYSENDDFYVKNADKTQAYSSDQNSKVVSKPTSTLTLPVAYATPSPTMFNSTSLDHTVYFDFNQTLLSDESQAQLKNKTEHLQGKQDVKFMIHGYTDQRGPDTYNQTLGLKRAEAVRHYLVSLGMPEDSIQVKSLGKDGAICTEETEACYQQNRRAHLTLISPAAQEAESKNLVTDADSTESEGTAHPEQLPTKMAESNQGDFSDTNSTIDIVEEVTSADTVATAVSTP